MSSDAQQEARERKSAAKAARMEKARAARARLAAMDAPTSRESTRGRFSELLFPDATESDHLRALKEYSAAPPMPPTTCTHCGKSRADRAQPCVIDRFHPAGTDIQPIYDHRDTVISHEGLYRCCGGRYNSDGCQTAAREHAYAGSCAIQ